MVRTVKDHLREAIDLNNVLQVWGRSLRGDKGKADFVWANSAQFSFDALQRRLMDV